MNITVHDNSTGSVVIPVSRQGCRDTRVSGSSSYRADSLYPALFTVSGRSPFSTPRDVTKATSVQRVDSWSPRQPVGQATEHFIYLFPLLLEREARGGREIEGERHQYERETG